MGRVLDVSVAYRRTFYFVAGGLTPTISLSKGGGSFNASSNAVVEIANGFYYLDLTTTETNTAGDLAYSFGSLGLGIADPDNRDQVGQLDVNVVALGGSAVTAGALPSFAAGAAGGLLINGTNTIAQVHIGGLTCDAYGLDVQGNAGGSGASARFGGAGGFGSNIGLLCQGVSAGGIYATAGGSNKDAIKLTPTGTGFGINGTLSAGAPTAAAIATAIFQDTTAGDFTVSGSIGASLFTGGNVPGATGGLALVGSNVGAATSVSGAVGSVTGSVGSVAGNVVGTVGGVSGVTFPATFPSNFSSMVISAGGLVKIQSGVTKNAAIANFPFIMSLANVPKTGLTVAAKRSIDGAAYSDCANAVAEVANGQYKINLAATDLNGTTIEFQFTATGADPTFITFLTTP